MEQPELDKLVAQSKSNDVEVKIDAVSKLQQSFESGIQIGDPESIINALKSCLRTSNNHLTTATLSALPPFLLLLIPGGHNDPDATIDASLLRQVIAAFLPAGGLIERLGDSREKARDKARESLVIIGGLALKSGTSSMQSSIRQKDVGKGPETPLMIIERFVREGGLQSKVWRVREQALLVLVDLRRSHPTFPLKPFVASLVELLEDTDGTVRECSRQSVVELFTAPTVTDAARADLKREMAKKGVRKTIVDSVLQKLLLDRPGSSFSSGNKGNSDASSESGDAPKKEYIPPSLKLQGRQVTSSSIQSTISRAMSTTTSLGDVNSRPGSRLGGEIPATPTTESGEIPTVYIASVKDLENEFTQMLKYFEGKETELNWAPRDRSITRIRGMIKGEVHVRYPEAFLSGLKGGVLDASFKTLASLRTTVAVNTCHLYPELTNAMGANFDHFCEPVLTHLFGMASLTKKITATLSQQVFDTVVQNTTPQPKPVLNLLWNGMQDKNVPVRQYSIGHIKVYLNAHAQRSKHAIETSGSIDLLGKSVKKGLGDPNPGVRESARTLFWIFEGIWKEKGAVILDALDATARKQLEKACPVPNKIIVPPSTPKQKKSSVAAVIAASRAKAKAIATAPPSLRHQATSTAQIRQSLSGSMRSNSRPTSPSSGPNGVYRSPSSPRAQAPSPVGRRVVSYSPPSAKAAAAAPAPLSVHGRSRSTEATSLSPSPTVHRRFASYQMSPPSSTSSTMETAIKTALPSSPRSSIDAAIETTLPPSPRIYHNRVASPTRIPSPTRKLIVRPSAVSLVNHEPFVMGKQFYNDASLLLAQSIPLPEESDSEDGSHMLSFSAPYEKYHQSIPKTATSSLSTGSPPPTVHKPIVEDALRARAEQAESAAERLLELVDSAEDDSAASPFPPSLLATNGATPKVVKLPVLRPRTNEILPITPLSKQSSIFRQAALFKDSPAYKGPSTLLDVLRERKDVTGWWLKRMSLTDKGGSLKGVDEATTISELKRFIVALDDGTANIAILKQLALLCSCNAVHEDLSDPNVSFSFPLSPTPMTGKFSRIGAKKTIWDEEKLFDRMFGVLMNYLTLERSEEELEYGFIVLWEIMENQSSLFEGHEADVFSRLLRIRYCNKTNVLEATNTIRDALISRIEPVYGLTTMHASLRSFLADPIPESSTDEVRLSSYAFGLIALGKFILRLPAEVLEDELPRLKVTLIMALNDSSSLVVRESAATCIIASQLVLRDETHLFTLLDGLSDEKKNLLTYLFDKHGARASNALSGTDKLEREMRRLDGRNNTPPRPK